MKGLTQQADELNRAEYYTEHSQWQFPGSLKLINAIQAIRTRCEDVLTDLEVLGLDLDDVLNSCQVADADRAAGELAVKAGKDHSNLSDKLDKTRDWIAKQVGQRQGPVVAQRGRARAQ